MARARTPAHRDSAHSSSSATGHEPAQAHERPTADKRRPSTDGLAERMQDRAPVSFSTGRVLALLADPLERLLIDERLSASGEFDVEVAPELRSAVDMASRHFDVAVVDLKCLTIETPTAVRLFVEAIDDTPVVVLGDSEDKARAAQALEAGAEDFVPRALLGSDALLHAVRRGIARDQRRLELDRLAFADPLTGLLNRRGFQLLGSRELEAAERLGSTFTLLFLDIDDLEEINTAFGHSAGDAALQETARVLQRAARAMDIVARVGDDEFCIALTDGSAPATTMAQRLGRAFDEANESRNGYLLSLTLGVVDSAEWRNPTLDHLVTEAAARMLTSKITDAPRRA